MLSIQGASLRDDRLRSQSTNLHKIITTLVSPPMDMYGHLDRLGFPYIGG